MSPGRLKNLKDSVTGFALEFLADRFSLSRQLKLSLKKNIHMTSVHLSAQFLSLLKSDLQLQLQVDRCLETETINLSASV